MSGEEELRASARLIGQALSGTVGVVGDMHRAIGRRVAGFLPAVAGVVTTAHETNRGDRVLGRIGRRPAGIGSWR